MKAFKFLSAIAELGISNDVYALFSKNAQIDAATFGAIPRTGATLWPKSRAPRRRVSRLKTNLFSFMKWNSRRAAEVFFWACFLGALIMSLIVTSEL